MTKKYSSLNSNTTLEFNKKSLRTVASGIDSKARKATWFLAVLVILGMAILQQSGVSHNISLHPTTSFTYHTVILEISIEQGQSGGGGGGHGNADLVIRHPMDAVI